MYLYFIFIFFFMYLNVMKKDFILYFLSVYKSWRCGIQGLFYCLLFLVLLVFAATVQKAVDMSQKKYSATNHWNQMFGHVDREIHLRIVWQHDGSQSKSKSTEQHKFIRVVGSRPIKASTG